MEEIKSYARKCCTVDSVKGRIPIIKWLPHYRLEYFYADVIAGFTVALMLIPQALAYAHIATLPPQFGLYSSFMGCFIYVFLGSSKDLTLGPTALMSLLTAQFCQIAGDYSDIYANVLCLFTGIVQFSMSILHLGIIVDFISHPVISGFTTSAAVIIAWGQVKYLLGLPDIPRDFFPSVIKVFENIGKTNLADLAMGIGSIIMLILLRYVRINDEPNETITLCQKICRKALFFVSIGKNAIIVIFASCIAYSFFMVNINCFTLTTYVEPGLPPFVPPSFSIFNGTVEIASAAKIFSDIGIGFFIVPLLGIVEAIAIGQAFARENSYRIDCNQELMAIGAGNILNSFVLGYPLTGSFSRTAVNSQSGVKTPIGGVVTGLIVLFATAVLTGTFEFIPQSALSAVIIIAVIQMTDFKLLLKIWKINKWDLLPWIGTFIGSLGLGVQYGILIGAGISFLSLLYSFARMNLLSTTTVDARIPGRDLFFPAGEYLETKLHDKLLDLNGKYFILDLSMVLSVDFSICQTFSIIAKDFARHEKELIIITPNQEVRSMIRLSEEELMIFSTIEQAFVEYPETGQMIFESVRLLGDTARRTYSYDDNGSQVNVDSVHTSIDS